MAAEPRGAAAHERDGGGAITDALSLFASRLSRRRFGDDELRVLEAALSSGGDVAAMLATRSEARRLLRERSTEAFAAAAAEEAGARLSVADFFARAFALAGDVEAFANALVHNHSSTLDSTNPILKKSKINDIRGLQNLAKSLSGQRSVQAQSAEYMKRKAPSISEKCNLQSEKPKLPGNMMFRLGIKTRNTQKLLCSRKRNLEDV
nr:uncharacterized protein LOC127300121 isoform X2 [Lolium perenne]